VAGTIAGNGPLALAATKRILIESLDWSNAEFFHRQAPIYDPVFNSDDAREGANAFAERRVRRGRRAEETV
jgi:enoyl-CoA hydratase